MGYYFEDRQNIFSEVGGDIPAVLKRISHRYLKENPPCSYTYRPYYASGIQRNRDYRYQADLNRLFPEGRRGDIVYAWGTYRSPDEGALKFVVLPQCPMAVFCNGEKVYESDVIAERFQNRNYTLMLPLKKGLNHLVIRFIRTPIGFGGEFGTWLGKLCYYFLMPGDKEPFEGFLYSEPQRQTSPRLELLQNLPDDVDPEQWTGFSWYPALTYSKEQNSLPNMQRIFGFKPGFRGLAWTKIDIKKPEPVTLNGYSYGPISLYWNGKERFQSDKKGPFSVSFPAGEGANDLIILTSCGEGEWGFTLKEDGGKAGEAYSFVNPLLSDARSADLFPWLFAGPFENDVHIPLEELTDPEKPLSVGECITYWRLDFPHGWVRQYNENKLYGHWNYPLGVTLYGLLVQSRLMDDSKLHEYVLSHIRQSVATYDYALWDKNHFGGATAVHHLMTSLDSLDDCGSFGSVLLEADHGESIEGARRMADEIADYIHNKQCRLPDRTFFRKYLMHRFHEDTLWADDLYMSVPFLCRYYRLTGDSRYLDDAVTQFTGFRKYLFDENKKWMSHVYDFIHKRPNGIPWGRGNGWTLFSLSELLEFLPLTHPGRKKMVEFFLELSQGFRTLQDESGMWHQILTDWTSYPETSCTAMFLYGFARGIRLGLYPDPEPFTAVCKAAWNGLIRTSVDRGGNVHGVCRGSEFSYSLEYYKERLLWNVNDTHGTGIVLLAGAEWLRIQEG